MHIFTAPFLSLFLYSIESLAAPAQYSNATYSNATYSNATYSKATHGFRVQQVPHGKKLKSGPVAMMQILSKYAKDEIPARIFHTVSALQNGSVAANPLAYDSSYLSPVQIGNQTLHLDFDTGSSDLWVLSSNLSTPLAQGQTAFTPGPAANLLAGATWKIGYADGSGASGDVFMDRVVIGGVTATSQAVEAATSVSSSFASTQDEDGLMGLAFSKLNTVQPQQQTTFFDTVKPTLTEQLFTVELKKGAAGTYDFGYIDSTKYSGNITYIPVNNTEGYWGFDGGSDIGFSIMDTGTSLFVLPQTVVQNYWNQTQGAIFDTSQQGWTFPCAADLPDFELVLGGTTFTVPGDYLNYAPTDGSGTTCFGGLQPNTNLPFSIFGDVFMKAHFVVFDDSQSSPRLGIAPQAS